MLSPVLLHHSQNMCVFVQNSRDNFNSAPVTCLIKMGQLNHPSLGKDQELITYQTKPEGDIQHNLLHYSNSDAVKTELTNNLLGRN